MGRPRIYNSDAERTAARKKQLALHKKTHATIGFSEDTRTRMDALKAKEEARLGFKLTYSQFLSMLIKRFEDKENT